jgi:poly(3-hydroxybutyrate) depolymerase
MKVFLFSFLLLIFTKNFYAQCEFSLDDSSSINTISDIQYGFNFDSKNQPTNLLMDIYTPTTNTNQLKPLMICIHGGSFVGGDRQDQRMDLKAQYFAAYGYVAANIEYRVQQTTFISPFLDFADPNNFYQAIIRGMHDLKAAIRYFKKDVAENGNTYGIDTNNIVLYGSSAGSIIALHSIFMDDTSEMNMRFKRNIEILGGLEGNSGNSGYSSTAGVKAILDCSGALQNPNSIRNNKNISYIGFHNNPDPSVPFDEGCYIMVACHLGTFYGSNRIYNIAKSENMHTAFYSYDIFDHPVDKYEEIDRVNFILKTSREFLKESICPNISTSISESKFKSLDIYPNPSKEILHINNPNSYKKYNIFIINTLGDIIYSNTINNFNDKIEIKHQFPKGHYFLQLIPLEQNQDNYKGTFVVE